MPPSKDLFCEAASAIGRILDRQDPPVDFGILGGVALILLGHDRPTKDLDCGVACNKGRLLSIFNQSKNFTWTQNTKQDVVSFMFFDNAGKKSLLVEFFPMFMTPGNGSFRLENRGVVKTKLLVPHLLFKGKLHAAATRPDHEQDANDLMWLAARAAPRLAPYKGQFDTRLIALAVERYPKLHEPFEKMGLDVAAAQATARMKRLSIAQFGAYEELERQLMNVGDIQQTLLYGIPAPQQIVPIETLVEAHKDGGHTAKVPAQAKIQGEQRVVSSLEADLVQAYMKSRRLDKKNARAKLDKHVAQSQKQNKLSREEAVGAIWTDVFRKQASSSSLVQDQNKSKHTAVSEATLLAEIRQFWQRRTNCSEEEAKRQVDTMLFSYTTQYRCDREYAIRATHKHYIAKSEGGGDEDEGEDSDDDDDDDEDDAGEGEDITPNSASQYFNRLRMMGQTTEQALETMGARLRQQQPAMNLKIALSQVRGWLRK